MSGTGGGANGGGANGGRAMVTGASVAIAGAKPAPTCSAKV